MGLYVDNKLVTIFRVAPKESTLPGYVQLICGEHQATHGYTLPVWWVNEENPPNIKTSGHTFSHSGYLF